MVRRPLEQIEAHVFARDHGPDPSERESEVDPMLDPDRHSAHPNRGSAHPNRESQDSGLNPDLVVGLSPGAARRSQAASRIPLSRNNAASGGKKTKSLIAPLQQKRWKIPLPGRGDSYPRTEINQPPRDPSMDAQQGVSQDNEVPPGGQDQEHVRVKKNAAKNLPQQTRVF